MERRSFVRSCMMGAALCAAPSRVLSSSCRRVFRPERLPNNPLVRPGMDPRMEAEARDYGYVNINGPSLIRVPPWVSDPLGKYYLYFAHHKGVYIRLAYSDHLTGPWKIYGPGTLQLEGSCFPEEAAGRGSMFDAAAGVLDKYPPEAAFAIIRVGLAARIAASDREAEGKGGSKETRPHIASPHVIIDNQRKQIRMYYHGMLADSNQMSRVAVSEDGIKFNARQELLTSPYLRVFRYRGMYYGLSMPGLFCRSQDGLKNFEIRPGLIFGVNMRHCGLLLRGKELFVFYSRVGDAPERILCSQVDLSSEDWNDWKAGKPREVMRPQKKWEGADLPVAPSRRGEITGRVNQLRDPAIFEEDGKTYLLYACAGEHAIAIARLYEKVECSK